MQLESVFAAPLVKREDETLYQYCLSFSPAAPWFGVPYRFTTLFKPSSDASPVEAPAAEEVVEETAAVVEEVAEAVEDTTEEMIAAAEPMAEAAEEMTETAVEAAEEIVEETVETSAEIVEETSAATEALVEEAASAAPELLYDSAPAVIDDLKLLKGVGPKLEAELNGIGIYTFAQIAAMTEANLAWIDEQISSVRGRPIRDDWAGQAKALAG